MSSNTKVYEDKMKSSVDIWAANWALCAQAAQIPLCWIRSAWIIMVPPLPSSRWHPWLWPKHAP